MNELVKVDDIKTMTSTQLAKMLGKEKSYVNREIRKMFRDKITSSIIASSIDSRGYVSEYHLGYAEVITFIGNKNIEFLESISKHFVQQSDILEQIIDALKDIDTDDLPPDYFVYVAREEFSQRIKIGISKHPEKRVEQLNVGNPEELTLIASFKTNKDGYQSETAAHELCEEHHIRSEWYDKDTDFMQIAEVV